MDHRVFCFDNVIFGLEEGVLKMQFNVFRLKSGVFGLYVSFEIRDLVSRLHPLNGGRPKRNRFRTPFLWSRVGVSSALSIGPSPPPTPSTAAVLSCLFNNVNLLIGTTGTCTLQRLPDGYLCTLHENDNSRRLPFLCYFFSAFQWY